MAILPRKCKNGITAHDIIDVPMIQVIIERKDFFGMFDSTSKRTLAGLDLVQHLRANNQYSTLTPTADARLYSRYGTIVPREEAVVRMSWAQSTAYRRLIYIPELTCDLILGRDFMRRSNIVLNFPRGGWSYTFEPNRVYIFESICQCCNIMPTWRLFIKKCGPETLAIPKSVLTYERPRETARPWVEVVTVPDDPEVDPMEVEFVEAKESIKFRDPSEVEAREVTGDKKAEKKKKKKKSQSRNRSCPDSGIKQHKNKEGEGKAPVSASADLTAVPAAAVAAESREELLRSAAQKMLDEINHIYDILDSDNLDATQVELNLLIKRLLVQHRSINQQLNKN